MAFYLKQFEITSEYNTYINGSPLLPNVSLTEDDSVVHYTTQYNVGDILYWNGYRIKHIEWTDWDSTLGTAVAVCVVPSSHNVYGTNSAGFVSVNGVNPDGSSSNTMQYMQWSSVYADTQIPNYTVFPVWENTLDGKITDSSDLVKLSSDAVSASKGTVNVIDTTTYYYNASSLSDMAPTPYWSDGSLNSGYTLSLVGGNAFSNFDGLQHTIDISANGEKYQAANSCHLFSTYGIKSGKWYLPTAAELGYLGARKKIINEALDACGGVIIPDTGSLWSSTEHSSARAYTMGLTAPAFTHPLKDTKNAVYVRPFTVWPLA